MQTKKEQEKSLTNRNEGEHTTVRSTAYSDAQSAVATVFLSLLLSHCPSPKLIP